MKRIDRPLEEIIGDYYIDPTIFDNPPAGTTVTKGSITTVCGERDAYILTTSSGAMTISSYYSEKGTLYQSSTLNSLGVVIESTELINTNMNL